MVLHRFHVSNTVCFADYIVHTWYVSQILRFKKCMFHRLHYSQMACHRFMAMVGLGLTVRRALE